MNAELQRLALRHLGGSLLVALICITLGATLLWAARHSQANARASHASTRDEARQLHERYLATRRDEALLRETIARFETLRQQGLIGPENRLEWANGVRSAALALRLPPPEFTLAPRRSLGKIDAAGLFNLQASQMKLSLELLHEGDLLALLERLAARPDVLLHPQRCLLVRNNNRTGGDGGGLHAECALDWISITPPATVEP
ncbi:hypothetical protein [Uliginosibacterium sp. TH139]|uniref:hypothetical protein n=1 Tax=Uliginosibacterium sp. TH139 TaxID=2067453 RepID=UPI000C79EDC2|nr:hypothetical protein [Uliginosibacterium sp. TH139]PLK47373.1 hypothetical protein C0V76_17095 [Uliginosibacterium sp. TH139]